MNKRGLRSRLVGFLREQDLIPMLNEPLSRHCTWRIGGPADFLVEPSSWQQVAKVLRYTSENDIPVIVIGKGSNLLFDDAGLRGVVIKIGHKLSRIIIAGTTVRTESGISSSRLAHIVGQTGLSGLEHIVGIPGTLGGLVCMNGGSRRKAVGDVIVEVKTMDRKGITRVFRHEECGFAYRRSKFQNNGYIVTEVTMELVPGQRSNIMAEMLRILRERRRKFPMSLPNCGSVFKSEIELYETIGPPGKVIEELGLKGYKIGGAEISCKHANFIVNKGKAKSQDVLQLIKIIRKGAKGLQADLFCEVLYVDVEGIVRYAQEACE